jgi:hypothetical protein
MFIADKCTWQQTRLAKDLKAVADTEYVSAAIGKANNFFHDRRESGDGACAKIISVGEAPWKNDRI